MGRYVRIQSREAQRILRAEAEKHGLTSRHGPHIGGGNVGGLIAAIGDGEIVTVRLSADERTYLAQLLRNTGDYVAQKTAQQLEVTT